MAEEFAHDAMVDRLTGSSSIAAFITRHGKGYWTEQFSAQQKFVSALLPLGGSDKDRTKNGYQEKPRPVLEAFVWQESLLINGDALAQSAQKLLEDCRVAGETLSLGDILARARSGVPVGRRIDHLNALLLAHELDPDWQFLDAILSAVDVWSPSPAVSSWCDQKLPRLISENLPDFARSLPWQDRTLAAALAKANLSDEQIQAILLRGIESNTDHLSAAITFALAGEIGTKLTPKAAADLCAWYLERLAKRIPPDERENMPPDTLASSMSEALARLFYAYLGDVDVRVRWRTAHALRRLARLGQTDILMAVASQYDRMTDGSFRNPKAPYYWIASRMWLVIALDRIAHETPSAIASLAPVLLKVALDHEFPHLLIRAYAADACRKLVSAGLVELTPDQQSELAKVNVSTLPAGNREREYGGGFDRFDRRDEPTRRFHFDGLDTLRYWYAPWLRAFDDLTPDALLEVAESWIVDKWGVQDEKPYGSKEPRARRFSERAWALSSTSHGSLPTLERYKSHLEWHAMWCAAGQLLDTHRVKPPDYDDASDNELQYQISQEKLTQPPIWLADLVGPRPLEEQRWRAPDPSDPDCFNSVADDVFLAELFPADRPGYVVVDAHTELRHGKFRESTRVQSGVVSPETAHSLVRALQTVEDASDFYICPEDHELEIDDTEFKLLGWLRSPDGDSGLDKQDVFRNGVSRMQAMPGRLATERLRLTLAYSQPVCWLRPGDTEPAFIYEAWGEREREDDRGYYDERIVSSGYRLLVRKTDLAELLASEGFDLITEVGVKRREQGGGRYAYDAQDAQEAEFDRILLLLRQAGEIAAAERSLGAWRPIGS